MQGFQEMFPQTNTRVEKNTPRRVNDEIRVRTDAAVARHVGASKEEITNRLSELDRECIILTGRVAF